MADLYGLKVCPVGGGEIRGAGSLWICPEVWTLVEFNSVQCLGFTLLLTCCADSSSVSSFLFLYPLPCPTPTPSPSPNRFLQILSVSVLQNSYHHLGAYLSLLNCLQNTL